jgi:hypothetical protein
MSPLTPDRVESITINVEVGTPIPGRSTAYFWAPHKLEVNIYLKGRWL